MKVIWKADFDGDLRDVKKLNEIQDRVAKKTGIKYEGPFFPQDASLMYIFDVQRYEDLNRAGRLFFAEMEKSGLKVTPLKYEVAVTPEEFFDK